jgi:F0F1-type ATP synthase assembly protein I
MSLFGKGSGDDPQSRREYRQAALLASVPALLFAGPAVGFFAGKWLDSMFGTEPTLTVIGALLGFAAAGIETYSLVKRASALNKSTDDDKS